MNYNIYLYISMMSIFIAYVAFIWIKFGIQKSISESYYALPNKLKPLFTFFCWGFSIPLIIIGSSVLMFFAGAGIAFVGAAASMHEKLVRKVHVTAAVSGIISGFLAIIFQYHMWYMVVICAGLIMIMYFLDKKHVIWWLEVLAFLTISTTLGISLL